MENRNGLIVDVLVTQATGTAEREAALQMLDEHLPGPLPDQLASDRGYHTRDFTSALLAQGHAAHSGRLACKESSGRTLLRLVGAAYCLRRIANLLLLPA